MGQTLTEIAQTLKDANKKSAVNLCFSTVQEKRVCPENLKD